MISESFSLSEFVDAVKDKDYHGPDSIAFYDRPQPDDACLLQVSVMRLPPGIDWSGLPLTHLLTEAIAGDGREVLAQGEVRLGRRGDLELAWTETRVMDPAERREACSRWCLARRVTIQVLITMDLWLEDTGRFGPVWDDVLGTLRLGEQVADPGRAARN